MKCWIRGDISGVPVSSGRIRRVKVWRWFGYEAVRALVFSPEMGSLVLRVKRPRLEAGQPTLALNSCRAHNSSQDTKGVKYAVKLID